MFFIIFFNVATEPETSNHPNVNVSRENVKSEATEKSRATEQNEQMPVNTSGSFKDDEIEMKWDQFPRPVKVNEQGIIKRQGDVFSGDIPYNDTVSFVDKFSFILRKVNFMLYFNFNFLV